MQAQRELLTTNSATGTCADQTGSGYRREPPNNAKVPLDLQVSPRDDTQSNPTSKQLSNELAEQLQQWAAEAKARFPALRDRRLAEMAGKFFLKSVKPSGRPGRPQHADITQAVELWNSGTPWGQVPRKVIPNFHRYDPKRAPRKSRCIVSRGI